ncbi:MAG: TonB-dependent receptor [Bacteroidota bacterium]|nr:TonB-dependent receptor [Bacteroidota bacterium]MDP4190940.1 TonB-dependent receptor [Bacteroidota bacterium]MDP4195375.1 TonB-dependent receptor [Bacteroidota bacterium]
MNHPAPKHSATIILIIVLLLSLLSTSRTFSQSTGSLRGLVTDSSSAEVLVYASVYIQELKTGAFTDSKGYFVITSIPANHTYTLVVSYTGYNTRKIAFRVNSNKMSHLDIKMISSSVLLPTIEKVEKRYSEENSTNISMQRISIKDLEYLPKGVENDIIRSLHYMPGVRSTGDISARYYIRGGASNQNLVQINNATIYNPFHALGLFSVVDPEIVNSAEFYKGGFPSEYSGRLSSILNLSLKDGNKNSYSSKLSASYLSAKGLVEGPIPFGSFILTGRKSFSSQIYKKFINKDMPLDFYDMAFKANYSNPDFIEGSKLVFHGFMSKDKIEHEEKGDADMNWDNKVFGFNWFQISDSPLFFELGVSASSFSGEVIPNQSSAREKKNDVRDVNVRMDFHYVYDSKDELGLGLNILDLDTKLFLENSLGTSTDLSSRGTNFSFYVKYKFLRVKNLGVEIGSRVNVGGLTKKGGSFLPEPRFSFSYRIIPEIAIKGAWGIFQQEVTTLSDENELISLFEPWIIIPPYLEPERSKHFILGTDISLTTDISFELEGYYKDSKNLAMINESKIYPTDNDFVSGSGESYGFESMLRLNFGNFNFSGGYSMSWAYNELNGWLFYPKYDARHSCNLSVDYSFADGWQFSAVWTYSTGMPYTKLTGFYDKLNFEDIFTLQNMGNYFKPYLMLGDKNLGRLPSYHRLDLNLSRKFTTNLFNLYLDLSILNVYDRKNIFYFERDTGKRINMLPFLPTATLKIEI